MKLRHPNLLDRLRRRYNPHHLYPDQMAQVSLPVGAGIIHKLINPGFSYWQLMGTVQLQRGSALRFLGHGHDFRDIYGDFKPYDSFFELVHPIVEDGSEVHFSPGDLVLISPPDRSRLTPLDPA